MDLFSRISTILCALCVFCTAAEQRRAEIYVDEDLYKDAKVLEAVQKYAGAVEKELNFKIDIKSESQAQEEGLFDDYEEGYDEEYEEGYEEYSDEEYEDSADYGDEPAEE